MTSETRQTIISYFEDDVRLFANYHMLTLDYDPPRIIARDPQIQEIIKVLKPGYKYRHSSNALISGPPGTGKSVVVRHVIKNFIESMKMKGEENVKAIWLDPGLKVRGTWSTSMILYSILQEVAPEVVVKEVGVSAERYWKILCRFMNENKLSLIITFEEAEKMESDDILYNFTRANENRDLDPGNYFAVFLITNDAQYKDSIEPRIISSLQMSTFMFPKYNAPHMRAILEDRRAAFVDGVLAEDVIPQCAAMASKEYGDARIALQLLRDAGLAAEGEGSKTVEGRHLDIAMNDIEVDGALSMIGRQTPSVIRVIEALAISVRDKGSRTTSASKIMIAYNQLCHDDNEKPVSQSRISQIITEIAAMGLVTTNQKSRNAERTVTLLADPDAVIAKTREWT
jgi:archaeal cell division control protein 6